MQYQVINIFTGSSKSAIQKSEACQTSSYLTQGTPRKKKMQIMLVNQHKQLVRLKKKEKEYSEKKSYVHLKKIAPQAKSGLC